MQDKSKLLVDRIRASRAKPPLDASHFEALVQDVETLGAAEVMDAIRQRFERPSRSAPAPQHPLTDVFIRAQRRTFFPNRQAFVDAIVDYAIEQHGAAFKLRSKARTMPTLLATYEEHLSSEALEALLNAVAAKHAHSR